MFGFLRLARGTTRVLADAPVSSSREGARERLASAVTALAGVAALAIAVAVPASYFIAARIIETIREPVMLDGQQAFVGLSVGIALGTGDIAAGELAKQADIALYQAKDARRGVYRFF